MLVRVGRCAVGLLKTHPSFHPLASPFAAVFLPVVTSGAQGKLAIVSLLYIQEIISQELGGQMVWLTAEFVSRLHELIVLRHFLLSPADLILWQEEPEAFALEESHSREEDNVRAAALQLFYGLLKHHSSLISPPLSALLREYMNPVPPTEVLDVGSRGYIYLLRKEAVYTAVGVASDQEVSVDFKQWYPSLCAELRCPVPFIRRRVLLLLREWMSSTPPETRLQLLASLSLVIRSDMDVVVRLAALQCVRSLITMHLDASQKTQAVTLLPQLLETLFVLLRDLQETESKTGVVYVLRILVKCFESSLPSLVPVFLSHFPSAWESCRLHTAAQVDLLTLLSVLVGGLGDHTLAMYPFLHAMITYCLEPGAKDRPHLERPGLALWLSEVKAGPMQEGGRGALRSLGLFGQLWPYWVVHSLLETDLVLDVAEAYVVCGKGDFVRTQLSVLSKGLYDLWLANELVRTAREVMVVQRICGVCNYLTQICSQQVFGWSWFSMITQSVCKILYAHFGRFPGNTLTSREQSQEYGMGQGLLNAFVPFLARLCFIQTEAIVQLLLAQSLLVPLWEHWVKTAKESSRRVSLRDRRLCVVAATFSLCLSSRSSSNSLSLSSSAAVLLESALCVHTAEAEDGLPSRDASSYSNHLKQLEQEDVILRLYSDLPSFVQGSLQREPALRSINQ